MAKYRYNGINELKDEINSLTNDIEFIYRGQHYSISPMSSTEIYTGTPTGSKQFKSADDLLDNFIIDGQPLKAIVTDIEVM